MRWKKWSEYAIRSECETYAISRAVIDGKDKYTAWRLPKEALGYFTTPQEAKSYLESIHVKDQKAAP